MGPIPASLWNRTSAAIAAGLMMIFFSKEAINDERVQDLKLKALNAAFSASFTLTLIVNWFLNREFDITRDFNSGTNVWRSISAFDLIILTLATALVLFQYWRFKDGDDTNSVTTVAAETHTT